MFCPSTLSFLMMAGGSLNTVFLDIGGLVRHNRLGMQKIIFLTAYSLPKITREFEQQPHENNSRVWPRSWTHEFNPWERPTRMNYKFNLWVGPTSLTQEFHPRVWSMKLSHELDPRIWPESWTDKNEPREWPTSLTHENDPPVQPTRFTHEYDPWHSVTDAIYDNFYLSLLS